jgi:hypothetical protein
MGESEFLADDLPRDTACNGAGSGCQRPENWEAGVAIRPTRPHRFVCTLCWSSTTTVNTLREEATLCW